MRRGNQGKAFLASPSSSIPNPPRHLVGSLHLGIGWWRSWLWVQGSGIERQGLHENGFGGGDDENGDDDDDEDDGGDNGCCSFCLEMGRFSWLIGGKMEQSSLVGESLSPPWTILSIGFFQGLDSFTFFWIFMNQNQIIIHFVLCYAVLLRPRSAMVLCCRGPNRWWFFVFVKPRSMVLTPVSTSPLLFSSL